MRILSKAIIPCIGLCICSFLLLTFKTPFGSTLFKLSMFTFAGIMVYNAYIPEKQKISIKQRIFLRIGGVAMGVLTVGILFRFIFWNGWELEMKAGGIMLLISAILLATAKSPEQQEQQDQPAANFFNTFWLPLIFLAMKTCIALLVPEETLYNNFTTVSKEKSYTQFKADRDAALHGNRDTTRMHSSH